jgi:hypothetical protein
VLRNGDCYRYCRRATDTGHRYYKVHGEWTSDPYVHSTAYAYSAATYADSNSQAYADSHTLTA